MTTQTNYSPSDLVFRLVDGAQKGTLFPISTQKCLLGQSYDESGDENGHCAILRGPNGASIKSFGTEVIVNGQPIESQWLQRGDQIQVGAAKLEVVQLGFYDSPESAAVQPTAEPESQVEQSPIETVAAHQTETYDESSYGSQDWTESQSSQPGQTKTDYAPEAVQFSDTAASEESFVAPTLEPQSWEPSQLEEQVVAHAPEMSKQAEVAQPFEDQQQELESQPTSNTDEISNVEASTEQIYAPIQQDSLVSNEPAVESVEYRSDQAEETDPADLTNETLPATDEPAQAELSAQDIELERVFASFKKQPETEQSERIEVEDCSDCTDGSACHCDEPGDAGDVQSCVPQNHESDFVEDSCCGGHSCEQHDQPESAEQPIECAFEPPVDSQIESAVEMTADESPSEPFVEKSFIQSQLQNEATFDEQEEARVQLEQAELSAEARLREVFSQHRDETADEVVYDPEEDQTTDSEPVEPENVAQLLARMQEQGQLHGYKESSDEFESQNPQPESFVEPPTEPAFPEVSEAAGDDDSSVQDYMNRLLGRMGGEEKAESESSEKSDTPNTEDQQQSLTDPQKIEPVELLKASEYKPSKRPPEINKNLDAMRELANQSNRVAIQKSRSQQAKVFALTNFGLMALGFALGGYLISQAVGMNDSLMWTGGAILGISLILGGAGAKALLSKK